MAADCASEAFTGGVGMIGVSAISGISPAGSGKGCGGFPASVEAMKSCQMRVGSDAAGHLVHRRVVVIAHPDAGGRARR